MAKAIRDDALDIVSQWHRDMDMGALIGDRLSEGLASGSVDLVALGKASREMASAAARFLGERVQRRLIISEEYRDGDARDVLVGDHPIPGERSLRAGRALLDFLSAPTSARTTLFLVSGGASSLCSVPAPPLTLADLRDMWDATVATGFNITELNTLRAATSVLSGGAVLRSVRTPTSLGVVLVDNVISGAPWVASGLTYEHLIGGPVLEELLERAELTTSVLARQLREATHARELLMCQPVTTEHRNVVLAEPSSVLEITLAAAQRRGYRVVDLGSRIDMEVAEATARWSQALVEALHTREPTCVVGVGEVIVRLRGAGLGGRCQEFAWSMMPVLASLDREATFVATSTDGRDFVDRVAGAYATSDSLERAVALGVDWEQVANRNDTYHGHLALGQLLEGGHTGWNLCDLYVALTR